MSMAMAIVLMSITSIQVNAATNSTYSNYESSNATELLDNSSNTQTIVASECEILDEMIAEEVITREDLNSDMLELSNDSEKELKSAGYNDSQIKLIKNYDGESDALEYISTNAISTTSTTSVVTNPTLTFRYGLAGSDNTKKKVRVAYDITWSACPFFTLTDSFGIGWIAADSNSYELATKTTGPVGEAVYYTTDGMIQTGTRSISLNTNSNGIVTANPILGSAGGSYAKHISGIFYVQTQSGSSNMQTIQIYVAYAHTILNIEVSPQITLSWKKMNNSISFSCGTSQEMLVQSHHTFKYNAQGEIVATGR